MSLKEKGNECYKQLRYEEAIGYYRQYTREDHSDNKNAYNNMGLSYYKLKEYQLAAESFENAIEEDRQYQKAYFWLVQVYKQMKDCEYQILINANQFLKYSKDQKIKSQIMAQIKEQKDKISFKKPTFFADVQKKHSFFSSCVPTVNNFQKKSVGSIVDWKYKWKQSNQTQQQKWSQIVDLIKASPSQGFNVAYLFTNSLSEPERQSYSQKIKILKAQIKSKPEPMCEQVNQAGRKPTAVEPMIDETNAAPQTSSEEQNLFESPVYEKHIQVSNPIKVKQTRQPIEEEKPEKTNIVEFESSKMSIQKHPVDQQPIKVEVSKQVREPIEEEKPEVLQTVSKPETFHSKMNIENARQLTPEELKEMSFHYLNRIQKSRDVFTEVYNCVLQILEMNESSQTKAQLIINIRTRRDVEFAFKNFSKAEKTKIEASASNYSVPIQFVHNKK